MFTLGFQKSAAAPGVESFKKGLGTAKGIFKKAPAVAAKTPYLSNAGRARISGMGNAQQSRVERGFAKSQGTKLDRSGAAVKAAPKKAVAPAAPATKPKPVEKSKGFMGGISKSHLAVGAGAGALGYMAGRSDSGQQR